MEAWGIYTVVYTCMISITHIHTTAHTPTKLHIRIYSLQVEIFKHEYTLYFHRLPIFRNTGIYQPMLENDIFGELEKIYRQFDETGKILLFSIHQEYRFNPHNTSYVSPFPHFGNNYKGFSVNAFPIHTMI